MYPGLLFKYGWWRVDIFLWDLRHWDWIRLLIDLGNSTHQLQKKHPWISAISTHKANMGLSSRKRSTGFQMCADLHKTEIIRHKCTTHKRIISSKPVPNDKSNVVRHYGICWFGTHLSAWHWFCWILYRKTATCWPWVMRRVLMTNVWCIWCVWNDRVDVCVCVCRFVCVLSGASRLKHEYSFAILHSWVEFFVELPKWSSDAVRKLTLPVWGRKIWREGVGITYKTDKIWSILKFKVQVDVSTPV